MANHRRRRRRHRRDSARESPRTSPTVVRPSSARPRLRSARGARRGTAFDVIIAPHRTCGPPPTPLLARSRRSGTRHARRGTATHRRGGTAWAARLRLPVRAPRVPGRVNNFTSNTECRSVEEPSCWVGTGHAGHASAARPMFSARVVYARSARVGRVLRGRGEHPTLSRDVKDVLLRTVVTYLLTKNL